MKKVNPQTSSLAACRGSGLDFCSYQKAEVDKCLELCRGCPIRKGCLNYALSNENSLDYGILGACTEVMRYLIRHNKYQPGNPLHDQDGNPIFRYWTSVSGYHKAPEAHIQAQCIKCGDEFSIMEQRKGAGAYPKTCIPCRIRRKARVEAMKMLREQTYKCIMCNTEYTVPQSCNKIRPWCGARCSHTFTDIKRSPDPDRREYYAYLEASVARFNASLEQQIETYIANRASEELALTLVEH